MCEYSCYNVIPGGANGAAVAWVQNVETGELGSVVAVRDGFFIAHAVDRFAHQMLGGKIADYVDADEVRYWCPLDVRMFDASGDMLEPVKATA